jgi:hypothetical protein
VWRAFMPTIFFSPHTTASRLHDPQVIAQMEGGKHGEGQRPTSSAESEQRLALELAKERGVRKHLETEVRTLRIENDKLKEGLASERAARLAMSGMFGDLRGDEMASTAKPPPLKTQHGRATSVDSVQSMGHARSGSNPFRNA